MSNTSVKLSDEIIENLSPGMDCPIIILDEKSGIFIVENMKWGLIPAYDNGKPDHYKLFNKRIEKLSSSYFSNLVKGKGNKATPHRCVCIIDGFYEWKSVPGEKLKQPYYIHSDKPLILAGIWDRVTVRDANGKENEIASFAILTCDSSPFLAREIHGRQPVMLSEQQMEEWLDVTLPPPAVDDLLLEVSCNAANADFVVNKCMSLHPVTQKMTTTSYQAPDCSLEVKPSSSGKKIDAIFSAMAAQSDVQLRSLTPSQTKTEQQQQQGGIGKKRDARSEVTSPGQLKKIKPNQLITDFFKA